MPNDLPSIFPWISHHIPNHIPMNFQWSSYHISMNFPSHSHHIPIHAQWSSYHISMNFPSHSESYSHNFPMIFLSYFHDFPITFRIIFPWNLHFFPTTVPLCSSPLRLPGLSQLAHGAPLPGREALLAPGTQAPGWGAAWGLEVSMVNGWSRGQ